MLDDLKYANSFSIYAGGSSWRASLIGSMSGPAQLTGAANLSPVRSNDGTDDKTTEYLNLGVGFGLILPVRSTAETDKVIANRKSMNVVVLGPGYAWAFTATVLAIPFRSPATGILGTALRFTQDPTTDAVMAVPVLTGAYTFNTGQVGYRVRANSIVPITASGTLTQTDVAAVIGAPTL